MKKEGLQVYRQFSIGVKWGCMWLVLTGAQNLDQARWAEEQLAQANELLHRGDPAAARELVESIPGPVRTPRLWNALGVSLVELDEVSDAILAFEAGIRVDPDRADLHLNLALALQDAGVPGRALAELERAVELSPQALDAQIALARGFMRFRRYADAERALQAAARIEPHEPRVVTTRAELADVRGAPEDMENRWRAAESVAPSVQSARRLAELTRPRNPEESLEWYEACVERDAQDVECRAVAGEVAFALGHLERAKELLGEAVEVPGALHNLLLILHLEGDRAAIENWIDRSPPTLPATWGVVALARRDDGDAAAALRAVRRGAEAAPEDLDLANLEAVLLAETGSVGEAKERWRSILEQDPDHEEARRNLEARGG